MVTWMLILLPVWLAVSAGAGLWYYFHREKAEALVEQARFAKSVAIPAMQDDLRKIVQVIGERNPSSEGAAAKLSAMASMIEGTLGPQNIGYKVEEIRGPADWPLIKATVRGSDSSSPPVWVLAAYDSPAGSPGAEANATGVAATLAAAQALAADKPAADIHFVFLPHGNDADSPIVECAARLAEMAAQPAPAAVLCVEAMGAGESLWLTSHDLSAKPLGLVDGLGKVVGAEVACLGDDADLASVLFEMDLPAVRVATRAQLTPDEDDARLPFAPTVAASAGRLIELIRRCAGVGK